MSETPEPRPTSTDSPAPAVPAHEHRSRRSDEVHEVVFVTYPKLLFAWPLILVGYLFWPFAAPPHATAIVETTAPATQAVDAPVHSAGALSARVEHSNTLESLGWAYVWVLLIVMLCMGIDVNRGHFAFIVVAIGLIWVGGLWLRDVKGFTLFGDVYRWFASLDIQYNRNLGFAISLLLTVPYGLMLVWGRFNDYWRITHNEFEHYVFGKMDDSLGRGAKTIRTEFPDMLELLLGMAGTLIVRNASGTQELRRIPHVMFLPFVRRRLNKVLERMAVTTANMSEEEESEQ